MHNFSTCVSTSRIYWQQNSKPALSSAIVNVFLYHLWWYRDSIEKGLVHPPPPAHTPARTPPLLAHSNRVLSSQSGIFVPSRNYILLTSSAIAFELGFPQLDRNWRKQSRSFQTETGVPLSTSIWFLLQHDLFHRLSCSDPVKLTRLEGNSDTGYIWKFLAVWEEGRLPQKRKENTSAVLGPR